MEAAIFNYKTWIKETNPLVLKGQLKLLLEVSEFRILGFTEHHFSPEGYTAVWILAESHLAIHAFPEAQKTYVELSSCNKGKNGVFKEKLEVVFQELGS